MNFCTNLGRTLGAARIELTVEEAADLGRAGVELLGEHLRSSSLSFLLFGGCDRCQGRKEQLALASSVAQRLGRVPQDIREGLAYQRQRHPATSHQLELRGEAVGRGQDAAHEPALDPPLGVGNGQIPDVPSRQDEERHPFDLACRRRSRASSR